MPAPQIRERVAEMLALVKLEPLAGRKPDKLSGGEQQRVALARALVKRPKLLLLDEPLAALDKKLREHTQFELANLQYQLGTTFVVVTHDQDEAMTLASRIAVMARGPDRAGGHARRGLRVPGQPVRRGLRRQHQPDRGSRDRRARTGALSLRCDALDADLAVPCEEALGAGTRICVAVRPEKITISRAAAGRRGSQRASRASSGPRLLRRPVAVSRAAAERRRAPGQRAEPAALGEA